VNNNMCAEFVHCGWLAVISSGEN